MAFPNTTLTPLVPMDPTTQRIAALEARVAALEAVIQIQSTGDVRLKSVSAVTLEAKSITINADTTIMCKAGAGLDLATGTNVSIKAGGSAQLMASSTMTIKGAVVNIN